MMRRRLAGTRLGSAAIRVRERLELVTGAAGNLLAIGDLRNNELAGFLVTHLRRPGRTFIDIGAHTTLDVFVDSHEYPRRMTDYFVIPSERLEEVSAQAREILRGPPEWRRLKKSPEGKA